MQDCSRDCILGHWTEWSECSRACGGGTAASRRTVSVAAVGDGHCPEEDSAERLTHKPCNEEKCPLTGTEVLKCGGQLDLILVIDGSGSLGYYGWEVSKYFATKIMDGFDNTDVRVAVILFSGPYTYDDYEKCIGPEAGTMDMERDCGLKMVQHFTNDTAGTRSKIQALNFPMSSTWTAGALEMAHAELMLGRPGVDKTVFVLTDGLPIQPAMTELAVNKIKETGARLMFGGVAMSDSLGMMLMQHWASHPVHDNLLDISDFSTLASIWTMNTIMSDMCQKVYLIQH
jgi:hypothetical protein